MERINKLKKWLFVVMCLMVKSKLLSFCSNFFFFKKSLVLKIEIKKIVFIFWLVIIFFCNKVILNSIYIDVLSLKQNVC